MPPVSSVPLALVGMSSIFPGSANIAEFWKDIVTGQDRITGVPPHYWLPEDYYDPDPLSIDRTYCKRGGFLSKVEFDPLEFSFPPNLIGSTDTCQLLALVAARQLVEDAAHSFQRVSKERVSVFIGSSGGLEMVGEMAARIQRPVWTKALRENGVPEDQVAAICDRIAWHYAEWSEGTFPGLLGNVIAGRIAHHYDFAGTNCSVDAACASASAALWFGAAELYLHRADMVIAGGVDTTNDPFSFLCFSKTPALSPTGDCRPFDEDADGTVLGEGLGLVALRRLADAERDGDRIYAVIRGIGSSSDGRAKSIYAPRSSGQSKALIRAYDAAGYSPDTVGLVEAHGTGTKAGDLAEWEALSGVFRETGREASPTQWCALGSVKSQIGHTKSAASAASLIKAALALHQKVLPPTIKVKQPHSQMNLGESPFYLNTEARPWIAAADHPRRASLSSFGFGGTNFHIALEEHAGSRSGQRRVRASPSELILLGGADREALKAACEEIAAGLTAGAVQTLVLPHVARDTQTAFSSASPCRLAIVAATDDDLREKLRQAVAALGSRRSSSFSLPAGIEFSEEPMQGSVAFLFPGQGSQYVGMGADLAMFFDDARAVWDQAAASTADGTLESYVFPQPVFSAAERSAAADALKSTRVAQPAIGAASLAVFSVLRHAGLRPDSVAGHSFGEVSALHAAGAVDLASALQISRKRGALMAEAAGLSSVRGTMLAVTAHAADVTETLTKARCEAVSVANHNAPRQVVLSGAEEAIEQADRALAKAGFVTQKLAVDTAFHSPMMHASLAPFEQFLQGVPFAAPATEMVSASSALPIERSASACRAALANAIVQPVRFVETIERLYESGVRYFIEAGPGTGLTALTGQILSSRPHLAVATDRKGQNGVTSLWRALGKLAVAGVPLSLAALWDEFDIGRDPRTRVKSGAEILIDGVNTGRKYPPVGGAAALPKPVVREAVPEPLVSKQPAAEPAPPIAQPAPAPVPLNTPDPQWMATFQEVQRQTAEAHMAYQRSVAETHMAFLRSAEAAAAGLSGRPSNGKTASPAFVTAPTPVRLAPIAKTEPPPFVMQAAPVIPTREAPAQSLVPAADLKAQTLEPPVDLETFLLTVVAEKTGYPREVLKLDMSLENDLGIDSIKRVEIFSSFKGRIQSAGKLDLKEMSRLATLRDVYRFLQSLSGETSAASAEAPGAPLAIASSGIERYVVTSHITRAPGQPLPGLYSGDIAIVGDPIGAGRALAARLKQHGIAAAVHRAVPANTAGLIYLEALRDFASVEDALQSGREAFLAARAFARSNAAPALFVTVQDSDSPSRAWSAGLSALAKTAGQEWPGVAVKALQLERGTRSAGELAEAIAQELLEGGRDVEVNLSASGERRVLEARPIAGVPHSAAFSLGAARTVIVSGGARGITPPALADFAAMHRPRLVLLGRTENIEESSDTVHAPDEAALKRTLLSHLAPNGHAPDLSAIAAEARRILAAREIRSNLRSLAATGAEVHYEPVDIRDSAALLETLARVREKWGPIGGLIHAAGVIADKRIAEKNDAQFDAVFSTKVTGLRNLLDATRQDALRLIVLFSSIAARLGNPGQCDYAMANAILSRIAASEAHARASHCLVKSIEWGPWEAGMAGPLAAHFRNQGIATISLAQGAKLLLEELSFADPEVVLAQIPASAQRLRNEAAEISEPALTAGL